MSGSLTVDLSEGYRRLSESLSGDARTLVVCTRVGLYARRRSLLARANQGVWRRLAREGHRQRRQSSLDALEAVSR